MKQNETTADERTSWIRARARGKGRKGWYWVRVRERRRVVASSEVTRPRIELLSLMPLSLSTQLVFHSRYTSFPFLFQFSFFIISSHSRSNSSRYLPSWLQRYEWDNGNSEWIIAPGVPTREIHSIVLHTIIYIVYV